MSKYVGEVIWFSNKKGFGFLSWEKDGEKQKDMFVHFSDVLCEGFKALYKGQKVAFEVGANRHGDPKAVDVTLVK